VDIELYQESTQIKSSLLAGSAAECLAWCSENRTALKKSKSPIEFVLRRQEFIELIRGRDLTAAMGYAKKHFPGLADEHELEIEQALALLAINSETSVMPYKWLYDSARWTDIAQQFDRDNHLLHGLPNRPQLVSLVHAGLSALKTPQCLHEIGGMKSGNINCPVCSPPLSKISKLLPFAHHETSLLVCPISGAIMDADNAPMALPNGHVYSLRALEQMAATMGGSVVCPRTNAIYRFVEARKCFIS
jgi:macrophage erythroblast attacher